MKQLPYIAAAALILIGTSPRTIAQDNNPTGITGVFNGNSSTAGSYEPYTANATRTVVDITVTGAVGEYPLKWSRTMNSRAISSYNTSWFGGGGGWRHSYSWQIDQSGSLNRTDTQPSSYNVRYPDGRVVLFDSLQNGTYRGPAGVGDRFQSFDVNATTRYVYLLLSDGGQVEFLAKAIKEPGYSDCGDCVGAACDGCLVPPTWSYTYTVKRIIDPFGGVTTLEADSAGRLATISEPAGRWIKIIYDPTVTSRISTVQAGYDSGAGTLTQTVTYSYGTFNSSKVLLGASYSDGTSAAYTYQAANDGAGGPLILTCNDVRYPGRMKKIMYGFVAGGFHGQLGKEMHPDGTAVATLAVNGNSRTETRGDLQSRTFTYGAATQAGLAVPKPYLLSSVTDFSGNKTYFGYDGTTAYLTGVKDPRGNTTSFTRTPYTGRIASVTPPPDGNGPPVATKYVYTDLNTGYYLDSITDALGHKTQFLRDSKNRRYTTLYPDGGTEEIVYDLNGFNQVHTFKNRSGGVETYDYNTRGQLRYYTPAPTASDPNPASHKTEYKWDVNDHLESVTDSRGNMTSFGYNQIGQVTLVTNPDADQSLVGYVYNPDGTLSWSNIQFGPGAADVARTDYAYDDYKRLTSVTFPAPSPGAIRSTVSYFYNRSYTTTAENVSHTANRPCVIKSPSGKVTRFGYDDDFRLESKVEAYGTADAATTGYTYDANGNLQTITDPRLKLTRFFYDSRNRLTDIDDAMVNAPVPHKSSAGHTTHWAYDQVGNKLKERRANDQLITFDSYDEMNRLLQQTVQQTATADAVTKYTYYPSGLLQTMKDPKLVGSTDAYTYEYDDMGRQTKLTYPAGSDGVASTEKWTYDFAGNAKTFTSRSANVQTSSYDTRNRFTGFTWEAAAATPPLTVIYDDASRVTDVRNSDAWIKNTYFNTGQLKSQEEWTTDENVHRKVNYTYDVDGNRATMTNPGSHSLLYDWTGRNQLESIQDTTTNIRPAVYAYDPSGNIDSIVKKLGTAQISTNFEYNAVNRCTRIANLFPGGTRTFDYKYNEMNNRTGISRDSGPYESYGYDLAQQSTSAIVDGVSTTFGYDTNGNRTSVNGGGNYAVNKLNQHTTFAGATVDYGPKGNVNSDGSGSYTYDAQNRLTQATRAGNTLTFKYDGLNRRISQSVNSGTATTYVYDGWNLIEEFVSGATTPSNVYIHGADGIVERLNVSANASTSKLYFHDALGNVSNVADASGASVETYVYDVFGKLTVYNGAGTTARPGDSIYDIRHNFTGELRIPELALYDLRNRFYSPSLTRFLQPDPIGFAGDPTNQYRYSGNNPLNATDRFGLVAAETGRVVVTAGPIPDRNRYVDSGGSLPSGGVNAGETGGPREFFQGIERPNGDFLDTIPADAAQGIVRAPPLGAPFLAPGVFPPGYSSGSGPAQGYSGPGEPTLGELYNYESLRQHLNQYGRQHQADLNSTAQFGEALYTGAGIYSAVGLGGMAAVDLGPELAPLRVDGPSNGFLQHGEGRIVGLRYGSTPLVRLDYHPLPGSADQSVLHLNVGPEGTHVQLWPWW